MSKASKKLVSENLYLLRLDDDETRYFEGLWEIPEGITYNAYLLTLPDHTILFDGWKKEYSEQLIQLIEEIVEPRSIDYIVVHHAEPDHTGSLPAVLEANGGRATVVGHPMTNRLLSGLYGLKPKFKVVRDGDSIELDGETIRFIYAPWLHWPETIVSFLTESKVLLTCDIFGGYSIPPAVFDSEADIKAYMPFLRKYTVTVISHYRKFIGKFLEKIDETLKKASLIAPGHGLLWRSADELLREYRSIKDAVPRKGKITLIYTSMYGYVESLARTASDIMEKKGYDVRIHSYNDKHRSPLSDILTDAYDSQGLVIATSTYEAGVFPIMESIAGLLSTKNDVRRPLLLLTVYGWGESAGRMLKERLSKAGYPVTLYSINGKPKPEDLKRLEETISLFLSQL